MGGSEVQDDHLPDELGVCLGTTGYDLLTGHGEGHHGGGFADLHSVAAFVVETMTALGYAAAKREV